MGNNSAGVEGEKIAKIVPLDRVEIAGGGNAWVLIEIAHIGTQLGIVSNLTTIAFEEAIVSHVESKQSGEKTDIR